MEVTVVKKQMTYTAMQAHKRVAAYARVSSEKEGMLHSLAAQVSHYSGYIRSHPGWTFAGIYADEGITGTKSSRPEFARMLNDCRAGKIDLLLTKSISRFARNTVDLLNSVRELKDIGVDVYFEEQNIHTMSGDGELMLTILASYAQEESLSVSENQKWRIRKNFTEGKPWNGTMLGYRCKDGMLTIVPEEADIVKLIFRLYLEGRGFAAIMKKLNRDKVLTRFGNAWCRNGVKRVLCNYAYTGNLLLQQTFTENHLTKKRMANAGQLPQYHAAETHEAIIPAAQFTAAQEEMARRAARHCQKKKKQDTYPFTGLITCAICGKHFNRKSRPTGPVWICSTYNTLGKGACGSKQIPEAALLTAAREVLGDTDAPASRLTGVLAREGNVLVFIFKDGRRIDKRWKDRSRSESWTAAMREGVRQANYARRETN